MTAHHSHINTLTDNDIARVDNLLETFFKSAPDYSVYLDLEVLLAGVTRKVDATTEKHLVHTLVEQWFQCYGFRVHNKMAVSHKALVGITLATKVISEHQLLEATLQNEKSRNMLAWMCLISIASRELGPNHPSTDNVGVIIEQWLGKPHVPGELLSTQAIINLMYGPGVWELCALDAGDLVKIPTHLYHLGLQVKGLQTDGVKVDAEVKLSRDLPGDFFG